MNCTLSSYLDPDPAIASRQQHEQKLERIEFTPHTVDWAFRLLSVKQSQGCNSKLKCKVKYSTNGLKIYDTFFNEFLLQSVGGSCGCRHSSNSWSDFY